MTAGPVGRFGAEITGRRGEWVVICDRCGASPGMFVSEHAAARLRWGHEFGWHKWPKWMRR